MPINSTTSSSTKVILGCSKCGASLPDEAQFCLKCGKSISLAPKQPKVEPDRIPELVEERPKRRVFLWLLLAFLLATVVWGATSENPFALGLQELVGWKHDQPVLETPFSVTPRNFRYYKFALPEGSMNVSIVGQFAASEKRGSAKSREKAEEDADRIEVYVLSESAFAVWQNGYATSSVFESGRVSQGRVQAELPPGAGIYYLVFSNRFSSKTAKDVNATVLLRYKTWVPDWYRRTKERFWNWVGS